MRVWDEGGSFKEKVLTDADIVKRCTPKEIEKVFDSGRLVRNVDSIFERVFGTEKA
jgi:adenylosuccinate lyase